MPVTATLTGWITSLTLFHGQLYGLQNLYPYGGGSVVSIGVGVPTGASGTSSIAQLPGMITAYTGTGARGFVFADAATIWLVDDSNTWGEWRWR